MQKLSLPSPETAIINLGHSCFKSTLDPRYFCIIFKKLHFTERDFVCEQIVSIFNHAMPAAPFVNQHGAMIEHCMINNSMIGMFAILFVSKEKLKETLIYDEKCKYRPNMPCLQRLSVAIQNWNKNMFEIRK